MVLTEKEVQNNQQEKVRNEEVVEQKVETEKEKEKHSEEKLKKEEE